MVTKLGQFSKLGSFSTFQLFKLSKLCYHFLLSFENENTFFFYIPSYPPPITVRNSLINQFWQKKIMFLYILKRRRRKKCKPEMLRRVTEKLVPFSLFLKKLRNVNFFGKIDWSMNSGQKLSTL